ncbi:MAG: DUF4338 domain-containing protein [Bacteroidota bacterium]|nr:DUF4338 domain-containing protein [Bacteroidota bacterium]
MDFEIKYRGRVATARDVDFINNLISENPNHSRRALSQQLCKAWNWVQANGALQDMICRGFMLYLESEGYIKLPPRKCLPNNPLVDRTPPARVTIDRTPIDRPLSRLLPLEIRQVRRSPFEKLFNGLISQYHYLGYCHPVGEHLKYIVYSQERPVACFSWSSSPRHIGCRDKFIGWSPDVRMKNLRYIAYNSRFLILPWIRSSNLASHLLGQMAKRLPIDWDRVYHHSVCFIETFVDTERFSGICYKAANWIHLGVTTGRGKNDQTHKPNRSIKAVWGYPLFKDFRRVLHDG